MSTVTVRQLIKEKFDCLSAKEQLVAKYVLDHYQQSMMLSSTELSEFAHVSDTTVVRFAKALGFSGFLEYRNTIKKEYVPTQKVFTSLVSMNDYSRSSSSVLNWYFDHLQKDISSFTENLSIDTLDSMVSAIASCETVYLLGLSSDETIICFLKNYLPLMGFRCVTISETGLSLKEKLLSLNDKDVVLMSAYPTLEEDELWAGDFIRKRGAKFLLITDSEITSRRLKPDLSVELNESAETFFNSTLLPLAFCNALLLRIYEKYDERVSDSLKLYQEIISS